MSDPQRERERERDNKRKRMTRGIRKKRGREKGMRKKDNDDNKHVIFIMYARSYL